MASGGPKAIENAFSPLGEVAAQGLFSSPEVMSGMTGFTQYLDATKLQAALFPDGQ
jgi:hypothetical protein